VEDKRVARTASQKQDAVMPSGALPSE